MLEFRKRLVILWMLWGWFATQHDRRRMASGSSSSSSSSRGTFCTFAFELPSSRKLLFARTRSPLPKDFKARQEQQQQRQHSALFAAIKTSSQPYRAVLEEHSNSSESFRNLTHSVAYAIALDDDEYNDIENDKGWIYRGWKDHSDPSAAATASSSSSSSSPIVSETTNRQRNSAKTIAHRIGRAATACLQRCFYRIKEWIGSWRLWSKKTKFQRSQVGGTKRHLALLLACAMGGIGGLRPLSMNQQQRQDWNEGSSSLLYHERVVHSAHHDQVASYSALSVLPRKRTTTVELNPFETYALKWFLKKTR